jgi:uncharacterized protein with PIN domain
VDYVGLYLYASDESYYSASDDDQEDLIISKKTWLLVTLTIKHYSVSIKEIRVSIIVDVNVEDRLVEPFIAGFYLLSS